MLVYMYVPSFSRTGQRANVKVIRMSRLMPLNISNGLTQGMCVLNTNTVLGIDKKKVISTVL